MTVQINQKIVTVWDILLYYIETDDTRIFTATKISYLVKVRFLSFTCEDITVVIATLVSANEIYKSLTPYCYNIQNTI